MLCFDAYFQESITERPEEQYRIRKCRVYFYPEDDTVQGLILDVRLHRISNVLF